MILEHLRFHRRVGLLAAGVLEGREREAVRAHVGRCGPCREELAALERLVRAMEDDPLREAEPDVPAAVVVARVERAVEAARLTPSRRPRWLLAAVPAAATALAAVLLVPDLVSRRREASEPTLVAIPHEAPGPDTEAALLRIERSLAREQAARYLSAASDVIVTVAASIADCDRAEDRLDVGGAPERSRELLATRRLLVEWGGEAVASARGVLDDVELALREVSELPSCVKRRDVERLRREVERRQLLMRIRLMTRELEG